MTSIAWQLLNLRNATRSEAFAGDRSSVRSQIESAVPVESRDDFAVLVLADVPSSGSPNFSRCPVLSVNQFLKVEF